MKKTDYGGQLYDYILQGKGNFSEDVQASSDGPAGRWWTSLTQQWQKRSSSCWIMQPEDSVTNPLNINPQRRKRRSDLPPSLPPLSAQVKPGYLPHSGARPLTHILPSNLVSTVAGGCEDRFIVCCLSVQPASVCLINWSNSDCVWEGQQPGSPPPSPPLVQVHPWGGDGGEAASLYAGEIKTSGSQS